jgi:hypothetical protein
MRSTLICLGVLLALALLVPPRDAAGATSDLFGLSPTIAAIPLRQSDPPPRSLPAPPRESDRVFVGKGTSLCTFKTSGPIRINIKTRYVGETNPDGRLKDPEGMIAAGVIQPTAELEIPVWDIDTPIPPDWPMKAEVDTAYINGIALGALRGASSTWSSNKFQVHIRNLKFPNAFGGAADNEVLVQIDTANADVQWCTAVEWASLRLKAMAPVVLIHGNNSSPNIFDEQGCTAGLKQAHVPFIPGPALPTELTKLNGELLAGRLPAIAFSSGAQGIHVLAHSKGGLDTRSAIQIMSTRSNGEAIVAVHSLSTLSTPHGGSLLADLKVRFSSLAIQAAAVEFSGFPGFVETVAQRTTSDRGQNSLTRESAAELDNETRTTAHVPTIFVGADADINGNREMDLDSEQREIIDLVRADPGLLARFQTAFGRRTVIWGLNAMYRTLAEVANITADTNPQTGSPRIVGQPQTLRQPNDILVTIPSALGIGDVTRPAHSRVSYTGSGGRNHASILSAEVCRALGAQIIELDKQVGGMR